MLSETETCFYTFFNNQKLLILFNKIELLGGKSLVKPWLNIYIFLSFIDNSFEECREILRREQLQGSIINVKLIYYTSVNVKMKSKGPDILSELAYA